MALGAQVPEQRLEHQPLIPAMGGIAVTHVQIGQVNPGEQWLHDARSVPIYQLARLRGQTALLRRDVIGGLHVAETTPGAVARAPWS